MEADFSGWATKSGLLCSDGRTIMPGAFKDQDQVKVPLVWQHGHSEATNVLGHALLEYRETEDGSTGIYAYGFFNDTDQAQHIKKSVVHGDVNMMSIWANQLVERAKQVYHGTIREVSLVLSGANPGALIENVTIRHDEGDELTLEDEVIIYTGLELMHSDEKEDDGETVADIYNSLTDKQKEVVHFMIGEAISDTKDDLKQSNTDPDAEADADADPEADSDEDEADPEADAVADADPEADADEAEADPEAEATADADADPEVEAESGDEDVEHSNIEHSTNTPEGNTEMTNVFEQTGRTDDSNTLSHSQLNEILGLAKTTGSIRQALDQYSLQHGIDNIDVMFPDAQAVSAQPDWVKRRTEWVDSFLSGTRKSPFSKIKSLSADITEADARAKGYITGTLKREEFFSVAKRTTEPTTVYKKQKLDRDDMIDITEYNVVAWLKAEMRMMLDEEIARACLLGDGRDVSSEDKINEGNIRPIVSDNELYTTVVTVNVDDANSSAEEVVDAIILNRSKYKGSGRPNFYTTETQIAKFLLVKDTTGRRIYNTIGDVAAVLRVNAIIPVEVMEEYPDVVGIMVNPGDYTVGANKGGEVNMFDDFDIDYNQMKYLIETRLCGALTKPKSALVVKLTAGTNVLVTPAAPTFDAVAGELTITNTTGVVYKNFDTDAVINAAGSPYAVASGETINVIAEPAAGYYFANSDVDDWQFTAD